jgi:hypothetical protein
VAAIRRGAGITATTIWAVDTTGIGTKEKGGRTGRLFHISALQQALFDDLTDIRLTSSRLVVRVAVTGKSRAAGAAQFIIPRNGDVVLAHPADAEAGGTLLVRHGRGT